MKSVSQNASPSKMLTVASFLITQTRDFYFQHYMQTPTPLPDVCSQCRVASAWVADLVDWEKDG